MEQARQQRPEPISARYHALVAEIVPKLRRLGPQLSEQTVLQTAERLAAHRLAGEKAAALDSSDDASPALSTADQNDTLSPLDDANVRHLAVSLAHRMRPVSQHLSEGELVNLATRMAVLETSSSTPTRASSDATDSNGAFTSLSAEPAMPTDGHTGAPSSPGGSPPRSPTDYDSATVTAMAEGYARADAARSTYPWLGLLVGAGIGYIVGLVTSHALDMRVDNAVTTTVVLVLLGSTLGLLLGRAKGNIEWHRLREDVRATLAAADRKRMAENDGL